MVSVFYPWQLNSIIDFPCLEQLPFATLSFLPFHNKSKSFQSASMIQHYLPLLISLFFPPFFYFADVRPKIPPPCLLPLSEFMIMLFSAPAQPPGLPASSSAYSFLKIFRTCLLFQFKTFSFFPAEYLFHRVFLALCVQHICSA